MTAVAQDEEYAPPPRRTRVVRRSEADVVAEGLDYIRGLPQAHARKVHGGALGNAGEPDLDAVVRGRAFKPEAKRPDGSEKPSAVQLAAMRRWEEAGALVGWFTSTEHLAQLLDHLDDLTFKVDLSKPGCQCGSYRHRREAA
jgi:hypothetical protein